jgi:hypothetical protein
MSLRKVSGSIPDVSTVQSQVLPFFFLQRFRRQPLFDLWSALLFFMLAILILVASAAPFF